MRREYFKKMPLATALILSVDDMKNRRILENRKDVARDGNRGEGFLRYAISILLLVLASVCLMGITITLWNVITDIKNTNEVFNAAYNNVAISGMSKEQVNQFKVLGDVYKNSRSFDVMSFFYMFSSSILIGLVIYYYNKINSVISGYEVISKTNEAGLKELKGLSEFSDILNRVSVISNRLNILESLFVQTMGSNIDLAQKYLPRLREDFLISTRILNRISQNKNEIVYSCNQITYLQECFWGFKEKVETLYSLNQNLIEEDTKHEFLGKIEDSLDILRLFRDGK